tara:strand:- start:34 stop:234 length:201 start_codon:yes stop_codon:yes gene_type:complete
MIDKVEKTYKIDDDGTNQGFNNLYKVTFTNGTISFVPHAEENRHYQKILEWQKINGNEIIDNGGGE